MERYFSVAIVTLLCSLMTFGMALTVARTHKKDRDSRPDDDWRSVA